MKSYVVSLSLSPRKMAHFYAGSANQVSARDINGLQVQFPLEVLRQYVTHDGVQGMFKLTVGVDNKLRRIEKLN